MPRLPTTFDDPVYDDRALADYTARLPVELPTQLFGQNAANAVTNLFTDVGDQPRYQLWPEKMIRSGATLPGDVIAGRIPMSLGLRREDYTDIPAGVGDVGPNAELIERTQDLSGMAGGGALGSKPNATLGSGPVRRIPHHEIPEYVYHATYEPYQTSIKENGLIAGKNKNWDFSDPTKVYLSRDPENAIAFAETADLAPEGNIKVIKIKTKDLDKKKLFYDENDLDGSNGTLQYHGNIDPKHLTLLSDTSASAPVSALAKSPVFYSAVEKAVKEAKQNSATGDQWLGYLRNQPGVKQEELDWILHELPKGQISKSDLEQFVKEHKVELKEVEKGVKNEQRLDELKDIENTRRLTHQEEIEYKQLENNQATKYSQWQLPGGSNYREMLLTLPNEIGDNIARRMTAIEKELGAHHDVAEPRRTELRKEYSDLAKQSRERNDFQSSHWSEPNVLAHIRTNERDIPSVGYSVQNLKSGNKSQVFGTREEAEAFQKTLPASVGTKIIEDSKPFQSLHIEEIQSDWLQSHRKERIKIKEAINKDFDSIADAMIKAGVIKKICD